MTSYFAPHCFHRVPSGAGRCPDCGGAFSEEEKRDFALRLIDALHHPLSEVRMRVIIALGWLGQREATDALVACALRNPVDVTEGLQIVESLAEIFSGEDRKPGLEALVEQHPSTLIRAAATKALSHSRDGDAAP